MERNNLNDFFVKEKQHININVNIGITSSHREKISKNLSVVLADSSMLFLKTLNYYWNIRGTLFRDFRLITHDISRELLTALDEIAERIRSLGYLAPGSLYEIKQLSTIDDGTKEFSEQEMIVDLIKSSESIARNVRKTIEIASNFKDEASVEMLTSRLKTHERNAWILRSLLER